MIKRLHQVLIAFFVLELLLIPFFLRINNINFLIIPNEEIKLYIMLQTLAHDAMIYFIIGILTYLSYFKIKIKSISYFLRFLVSCTLVLYIVDVFVIKNFITHININDLSKYMSYIPIYIQQEYEFNFLYFLLVLIFCAIIFMFIKIQIKLLKNHHFFFGIFILILSIINSFSDDKYAHSWVYKNFIEYNIDLREQSKKYSDDLRKNLRIDDKIKCVVEKPHNKNIIILMVESFASYQSNYFSGIKDWTPNLDKIAKSNTSIKNFLSNGFITEDAEISILTGLFPIYSPNLKVGLGSTAFQGFYNLKDSLPKHLNSKNYITEFITSADLEFSNTGKWAKNLGFDYVEGSEYAYDKSIKRFHFDAVADEFLLNRVLDRINAKDKKETYFMFIKTVSSHIPFINPETENYSEEKTIRYVDKQIGKFYKNLENNNYFDNGLLIITGDHHPIIPLKEKQIFKYGKDEAGTHVPFILSYGKNKNIVISEKFQHTDIYNSIKNYTSEQKCTSEWNGDFMNNKTIAPKYIPYRRGDRRGTISVFDKNTIYDVQLNGDLTKIKNQRESEITRTIVNKINYERMKRQREN